MTDEEDVSPDDAVPDRPAAAPVPPPLTPARPWREGDTPRERPRAARPYPDRPRATPSVAPAIPPAEPSGDRRPRTGPLGTPSLDPPRPWLRQPHQEPRVAGTDADLPHDDGSSTRRSDDPATGSVPGLSPVRPWTGRDLPEPPDARLPQPPESDVVPQRPDAAFAPDRRLETDEERRRRFARQHAAADAARRAALPPPSLIDSGPPPPSYEPDPAVYDVADDEDAPRKRRLGLRRHSRAAGGEPAPVAAEAPSYDPAPIAELSPPVARPEDVAPPPVPEPEAVRPADIGAVRREVRGSAGTDAADDQPAAGAQSEAKAKAEAGAGAQSRARRRRGRTVESAPSAALAPLVPRADEQTDVQTDEQTAVAVEPQPAPVGADVAPTAPDPVAPAPAPASAVAPEAAAPARDDRGPGPIGKVRRWLFERSPHPAATPEPTTTPEPDTTSGLETTPGPDPTPERTPTPEPDATPEPDLTPSDAPAVPHDPPVVGKVANEPAAPGSGAGRLTRRGRSRRRGAQDDDEGPFFPPEPVSAATALTAPADRAPVTTEPADPVPVTSEPADPVPVTSEPADPVSVTSEPADPVSVTTEPADPVSVTTEPADRTPASDVVPGTEPPAAAMSPSTLVLPSVASVINEVPLPAASEVPAVPVSRNRPRPRPRPPATATPPTPPSADNPPPPPAHSAPAPQRPRPRPTAARAAASPAAESPTEPDPAGSTAPAPSSHQPAATDDESGHRSPDISRYLATGTDETPADTEKASRRRPGRRGRKTENGDEPKRGRRRLRGSRGLRIVTRLLIVAVVAVAAALVLRAYVVAPYYIPSASMEPTLHGGTGTNDRILVDKITYRIHDPHQGDIVVFDRPDTWTVPDKTLVKRIIGLPGDIVTLRNGLVYINGMRLIENYLEKDCGPAPTKPLTRTTRWTIPMGDYFVLGDNRCNSEDSRMFGPIPDAKIVGRVFLIIWPLSRFGTQ